VNIDDDVWTDDRFTALGRELGGKRLPLHMQHALGLGVAAKIWRRCVRDGASELTETALVDVTLTPKIGPALIAAGLAEIAQDLPDGKRLLRIKGTTAERVGYLKKLKDTAAQGGEARAASSTRDGSGRFQPAQPSAPSRNQPEASSHEPSRRTSAPAPAPAPAPVQLQEREIGAGELRAHEVEQIGFSQNGVMGGSAQVAMRKLMPIHRDELEVALKAGGSSWAYTAKVLISMRAEAAKPASLAIRDGPSRHLTKQDQAIANNLAAVEQFNAQRR
jgi:hypothetical protein